MRHLIVDGNNAVHRLYHKLPDLSTLTGEKTQIVYGFLRLLQATMRRIEPDTVLVCWDEGIPQVRMHVWDGYKRERIERKWNPKPYRTRTFQGEHGPQIQGRKPDYPKTDKQKEVSVITEQIEMLRLMLPMLCVNQIYMDGVEADDLIAIACRCLTGSRVVLSADQDMYQLVGPGVQVFNPHKPVAPKSKEKGVLFTDSNFHKILNLTPKQFLEMRILTGDSTDGIPGVARGFGEKTARELLQRYGSISKIFRPDILKKIEKVGGRGALLCGDGVWGLVERNRLLMDLSIIDSRIAQQRICSAIELQKKLDIIKVKRYLIEKEFFSLSEKFLIWVTPFQALESM